MGSIWGGRGSAGVVWGRLGVVSWPPLSSHFACIPDANLARGCSRRMHSIYESRAITGGKSQLAGIVTALSVVLTLMFLTPFFTHVPKCVLASCLIVAVSSLVDTARMSELWSSSKGRQREPQPLRRPSQPIHRRVHPT